MTIKDRLLEALNDTDWHDLSEAALVEVLIARLQQAKADCVQACAAIDKECRRAVDIEKAYQRELHEMRTNPLAAAAGDYYFYDQPANAGYIVTVTGYRNIGMMKRTGRIDYMLQRISADQWASRVSKGIV